jgi:hypothetical protein
MGLGGVGKVARQKDAAEQQDVMAEVQRLQRRSDR